MEYAKANQVKLPSGKLAWVSECPSCGRKAHHKTVSDNDPDFYTCVACDIEYGYSMGLHFVHARFGQWAVTEYGVECTTQTYFFSKDRVWESDWEAHMFEKDWVDKAEFARAIEFARTRWPSPKGNRGRTVVVTRASSTTTRPRKKDTERRAAMASAKTVQFYKDGDTMGVRTTAPTSEEFLGECAEVLAGFIEGGSFEGDWDFQLRFWLPQIVEIACKLKGYKADVHEARVITAGTFDPPQSALVAAPGVGDPINADGVPASAGAH